MIHGFSFEQARWLLVPALVVFLLAGGIAAAGPLYDPFLEEFQVGTYLDPGKIDMGGLWPGGLLTPLVVDRDWTGAGMALLDDPAGHPDALTFRFLSHLPRNPYGGTAAMLEALAELAGEADLPDDGLPARGFLRSERWRTAVFRKQNRGLAGEAAELIARGLADGQLGLSGRERLVWEMRRRCLDQLAGGSARPLERPWPAGDSLGPYDLSLAWSVWVAHRRAAGLPLLTPAMKGKEDAARLAGLNRSFLTPADLAGSAFSSELKAGLGGALFKEKELEEHLRRYPDPPGDFTVQGWWVKGQRLSRRGNAPHYEALARRTDLKPGWRLDLWRRASELRLLKGQWEPGLQDMDRALAIAGAIAPDGDVVMEVMRRQGEALMLLGRPGEALPVLQRALSLAVKQNDRFEKAVICRVLAGTLLALGDLESAAGQAGKAVDELRDLRARHELMLALRQRAEVALARADSGLHADSVGLLEEAWQDAMGALDLALKTEIDHWILGGRRLLNTISSRRRLHEQDDGSLHLGQSVRSRVRIIHVSSCMRDVIQLADAFAESNEPVLITGETGTGKELFARRLHERSPRRGKEMVCVNVSAIAENIFAREFFGHVRGAFTGADTDAGGFAALADGGTLFLDEIGDLPLELQPQLLRLLQEGTYQAVGDPRQRHTDLRLVAATNADLKQLVATGRFRADLYYRLKILELRIPPVRERREDILPLLRHFLSEGEGHPVELSRYFNEAGLDRIQCHLWPGNVREIAMVARQAQVQLASRGSVCVELEDADGHPVFVTGPGADPVSEPAVITRGEGPVARGVLGRARILMALTEAEGNRAEAARKLGVSRSTLYRRMEKLGIAGKLLGT